MPTHRFARSIVVVVLASVALGGGGCQKAVSSRDVEFVSPVEATELARARGSLFGTKTTRVAWVDPRSASEFRKAHLPGAINLRLNELQERHPALAGAELIVVYGDDYNSAMAEAVTKQLMALGYPEVRTLQGGLRAWSAAGMPVEPPGALRAEEG